MLRLGLATFILLGVAPAASATAFDFSGQPAGIYAGSLTVSDPGIDLTVTAENFPSGFIAVLTYDNVGTRGVIASKTDPLAIGSFAPIRFSFSKILDSVTFLFGDGGGDGDNPMTISAYSAGGALLGMATTTSPDGFATLQTLTLNFTGASYYVASSGSVGGSGISNDDSLFYTITSYKIGSSPAVPEAATWAMMVAGFGIVGFAMRRERQSVVFA